MRLFHTQRNPLFFNWYCHRGPPDGAKAILFNYAFSTIIKEEES
jgi:hypothetical protein